MKNLAIENLKNISIFKNLNSDKLEKIKNIIKEASFQKDTTINKEGDVGEEMYILLSGEVEISRSLLLKVSGKGVDQKDKQFLSLDGKNTPMFGEMALFDKNSIRSATVIAKTKCNLGVISREEFFKLIESDHTIGFVVLKNMTQILCDRLNNTSKDVLKLTTALSLALEQ